jgi:hypothetical protein
MGHLKRGIDVIQSMVHSRPDLSFALTGIHSLAAAEFREAFLPSQVSVLEPSWGWTARVTVIDTMSDPEDSEYVDPHLYRSAYATSKTLVALLGVLSIDLPAEVAVLINHIPDIRISGPATPRLYVGFEYSPVAKELLANAYRGVRPGARRLLAIIGGNADQNGPDILFSFIDEVWSDGIDLIVSPCYPTSQLEALRLRYPRAQIVQNVPSIISYFNDAAAVVCTYGNAAYESIALHKPTYLLNYKKVQERYGDYLERKGLVMNLGRFDAVRKNRVNALSSRKERSRLAASTRTLFSGDMGIDNIARALFQEIDRVPIGCAQPVKNDVP